MKRKILTVLTAFLITAASFGQSAYRIDSILEAKEATFGQAAYLILTALDGIADDADFKTAFAELQAKGFVKNPVTAEDTLSFKQYAFLLMQAFNMKGGVLYRIYPCPRYAYRNLCFLSILQGKTEPDKKISGAQMLQAIGRINTDTEGGKTE